MIKLSSISLDPPWVLYVCGILFGLGAALAGSVVDFHAAIWLGGYLAGTSATAWLLAARKGAR